MENKINEIIEELKATNDLYKDVVEDIIEDAEGYNGTIKEQLETRLREITEHGCVSGTVGKLIYYSDTTKYYKDFQEDINALLYEMMEETGIYSLYEMFGDKFDKEDPLCINDLNQNLLAWFAYETVADRFLSALEDVGEEEEEEIEE